MKKTVLTVITAFSTLWAFSQGEPAPKQQNRHEFSLGANVGISSLQYAPTLGDHHTGIGALVGLGYTYYFNYNWGLSIGAEYQMLKGKYSLDYPAGRTADFLDEYNIDSRAPFDRLIVSPRSKLTEKQEANYINIPIMAHYEFDFPWKNGIKISKFSAGAGLKLGIPVSEAEYAFDGKLETQGAVINSVTGTRDLLTDMPNHGFSVYGASKGKFSSRLNVVAALEAGLKFKFNKKWGLYAGLFADFGLNDIVDNGDDVRKAKNYLDYNYDDPSSPVINTIFLSNYGRVEEGGAEQEKRFVDRVHTFAFGLKVAVTLGTNPFDKKEKVKKVIPVVPEDPWSKPITGNQMRELLKEQTGELNVAQSEEFESLKNFLAEEFKTPDLSAPVYCFDFDRDNIPAQMKAVLDHKIQLLKKHPSILLILEGHTDSSGSDEYNYDLGLRRAEAAKYYMLSRGITENRLVVTSKGRSQPIVKKTADENANCPNRRVEFIISK
ncbi:MAG: OmpA family protein [Bacteroidales bacterium]|jgi:peptidoglycan-associated lipoprotein|nr:OmpA family protein [Bacteroidales bacterium]